MSTINLNIGVCVHIKIKKIDNYAFSDAGLYKNSEYKIVIVFKEPMSGSELVDYLTENRLVYRICYAARKYEQL